MTSEISPDLHRCCAIAERAGRAILAVYEGAFSTHRKADDSPVTEADLRADALIREALGEAFPGVAVWSEESGDGQPASTETSPSGPFFLVDPLDGTKEFVKRNGEFTVNIAWIAAGRAQAGVVHAPALDVTWWGAPGQGAWRRQAGGPAEPVQVPAGPGAGPLRVLASRSHADGRLDDWIGALGRPVDILHAGSSLKFCRIAEGQADLYPRFGPTSQWDTAAGQAVLEGAGGVVTDLDGQPLRYGRDRPVINPDFVAARALSLWRPSAPATSRPRS